MLVRADFWVVVYRLKDLNCVHWDFSYGYCGFRFSFVMVNPFFMIFSTFFLKFTRKYLLITLFKLYTLYCGLILKL